MQQTENISKEIVQLLSETKFDFLKANAILELPKYIKDNLDAYELDNIILAKIFLIIYDELAYQAHTNEAVKSIIDKLRPIARELRIETDNSSQKFLAWQSENKIRVIVRRYREPLSLTIKKYLAYFNTSSGSMNTEEFFS